MSNETKNKVVPMLRFPEFKDSEEWMETTLVKLARFRRGSFPQPYGQPEWYDEVNGVPFIQVFDVGDDFRLKPKTKSKISKLGALQSVFISKGTVIITIQGSIGRVAITQYDAYIDRTLLLFEEFFEPMSKIFFAYVLFLLFEIEKQKAPGGIIKTITKEVLSDFKVYIPPIDEQQKIADCLSSLDEYLIAQSQKLEELKAHKKGLMQQLFPTEGETVPKLRFKKFSESGEWEEDVLGGKEIAMFINEKMPMHELQLESYVSTENLLSNYEGKTIASKLPATGSVTRFKKEDVLLSNIRPYLKKVWFADMDGGASNDVIVIRADSKIDASFLSFLLKNDDFINYIMKGAEGVKMPRGDKDLIKEYIVRFPEKSEQQKIADCLASLDELITAQAEKTEALKAHKKGLMQGLFPNTENIDNG